MADFIKISNLIPLDFVPGTHGHFLEYLLNRGFGHVNCGFSPFSDTGTSHRWPETYRARPVKCRHWSEKYSEQLRAYDRAIRIVFDQDDLLLVNSLCWLRAADQNLDNNQLHIDTVKKLNTEFYSTVLEEIYHAYPFLDRNDRDIPRYVLREFFKFGFADPCKNGMWIRLNHLLDFPLQDDFKIKLKQIYDLPSLYAVLDDIQDWSKMTFHFGDWIPVLHGEFLSKIKYFNDKDHCDQIIQNIVNQNDCDIPLLSLFQESYINGNLERIYRKEMPFCQHDYFKNTKDVLEYIKIAPNL